MSCAALKELNRAPGGFGKGREEGGRGGGGSPVSRRREVGAYIGQHTAGGEPACTAPWKRAHPTAIARMVTKREKDDYESGIFFILCLSSWA